MSSALLRVLAIVVAIAPVGGGGSPSPASAETAPPTSAPPAPASAQAPSLPDMMIEQSRVGWLGIEAILDTVDRIGFVRHVVPDGPAAEAGVCVGDRFELPTAYDIDDPAARFGAPGDTLTLAVVRGTERHDVSIRLGRKPLEILAEEFAVRSLASESASAPDAPSPTR